MINWLVESGNSIPIPILPPKYVHLPFLTWLVQMMDEYRDLRLIWTLIEACLMVVIAILIVYFIYKVKSVEGCLRARYKALDERVRKISELHKRADQLEGKDWEDV